MKDNYQFNGRPGMGKIKNSVKWASIVNSSANTFGLDPNFLGAIIEHESGWDLRANVPWSNKEGSGRVWGLGQIQDRSLTGVYSNYKDGDETIQIPCVARFLAMKAQLGSKNGVITDASTCGAYYGQYEDWYYKDVEKKKAVYESYDIPVSKDAKGKTNQGAQPGKASVADVKPSIKELAKDFKSGIVGLPNRLMATLGVSAIGLIAIIVLLSQSRIDNNEEL
jgi:hypothetical protein